MKSFQVFSNHFHSKWTETLNEFEWMKKILFYMGALRMKKLNLKEEKKVKILTTCFINNKKTLRLRLNKEYSVLFVQAQAQFFSWMTIMVLVIISTPIFLFLFVCLAQKKIEIWNFHKNLILGRLVCSSNRKTKKNNQFGRLSHTHETKQTK